MYCIDFDKTKAKIRNQMDFKLKYFKREKKAMTLTLLFRKINVNSIKNKMCNVRTYVTLEYEMFSVRTDVKTKNV